MKFDCNSIKSNCTDHVIKMPDFDWVRKIAKRNSITGTKKTNRS